MSNEIPFSERVKRIDARDAAADAAKAAAIPRGLGATPFVPGHGYAARFPTDALPERLRQLVISIAERKQVPVDLPALAALGMVSAVAAPRFLIRRDADWRQPLILQIAVAMESGGAKSPAVNELAEGVDYAEATLYAKWKASIDEAVAFRRAELDALTKAANRRDLDVGGQADLAAKIKNLSDSIDAEVARLEKETPAPPRMKLTGDTTPEALAKTLASNSGTYTVIDSEGTFFEHMTGNSYRGGKAANVTVILKGYDGDQHESGRIGEGKTARIRRTCLPLVLSPQPAILSSTLSNQALSANGFVNRFLVCVPGDLVGQRVDRVATYYLDAAPDRPELVLQRWWGDLLAGIAQQADVIGRFTPEEEVIDLDQAPTLNLTREAFDLSVKYEREFELRMAPGKEDGATLKPWGAKHIGRVIRLAGILHLAAGSKVADLVDESTMENAITIGEWSVLHYLTAPAATGISHEAERIAEHIEASEFGMVTRAEIGKKVFANRAGKVEIDGWVAELVATGRYKVAKQKTAGRARVWVHRAGIAPPADEQPEGSSGPASAGGEAA